MQFDEWWRTESGWGGDPVNDGLAEHKLAKESWKAALQSPQVVALQDVVVKAAAIMKRIYSGCATAEWGRIEDYRELRECMDTMRPFLPNVQSNGGGDE